MTSCKGNDISCRGKAFFTHIEAKKIYRFFVIRNYLLSVNSSGLYKISQLKKCAIDTGLSYTTLREDIKRFRTMSLIMVGDGYIKVNKLQKEFRSLWNMFINNESNFAESKAPAVLFSDLYKEKIIKRNVFTQIKMETAKCSEANGRKLWRLVRNSKQKVGEKTGVNLSVGTIGNLFGRTKGTGHRYIERMHALGIIRRFRNSRQLEIPYDQFNQVRKAESLYGRLFIRDGKVFERLMNSYIFLN
jgi:hypothetical protein